MSFARGIALRGAVLVVVVALGAMAAQATNATQAGGSAQKVPLESAQGTAVDRSVVLALLIVECNGNAPTASPFASGLSASEGFAVIHRDDSNAVAAEVVAQGAQPNATYTVELVQTPTGPCTTGTLTTDALGDGSVHLSAPLASATNDAFVFMFAPNAQGNGLGDLAGTPDMIFG
jgi:hypothetical protein